jgi:DNA-binding XRE family transcriptional regulator
MRAVWDGKVVGLNILRDEVTDEVRSLMPQELKAWREQHNLTQKQLAELLSHRDKQLSVITVSAWERGTHEPPSFIGLALAELSRRLAAGEVDIGSGKHGRWTTSGFTPPSGSAHHEAKFSEADIRKIRRAFDRGQKNINQLARQYEVNAGTISKIVHRQTWKHVI